MPRGTTLAHIVSKMTPSNDLTQLRAIVREDLQSGALVDLGRAARRIGTSPRTLQRTIAASGTSFRSLLQDVRREMALELLASGHLTVERVSEAVGYSDPKALRRAFHRWGQPPPSRLRGVKSAAADVAVLTE
jgi:AraC-like DNA-binding protein